jgi:hypothetical protein
MAKVKGAAKVIRKVHQRHRAVKGPKCSACGRRMAKDGAPCQFEKKIHPINNKRRELIARRRDRRRGANVRVIK